MRTYKFSLFAKRDINLIQKDIYISTVCNIIPNQCLCRPPLYFYSTFISIATHDQIVWNRNSVDTRNRKKRGGISSEIYIHILYIYTHLFLALRLLRDFWMHFCICKLNVPPCKVHMIFLSSNMETMTARF